MSLSLCQITGTVFDVEGNPAGNVAVWIVRAEKSGITIQKRKLKVATSDAVTGAVTFSAPRASNIWLYGNFEVGSTSFSVSSGVVRSVPDIASTTLESLGAAVVLTDLAQPLDSQLSSIAALADAVGALTNDGAGVLSWAPSSGGAWGGITGTLSAQSDLQSALNLKANSAGLATVASSGLASDLTGALADARLSANVPLLNVANVFTGAITAPSFTSTGSAAGALELTQGTAPALGTTSVKVYAAAAVTSYGIVLPGASATGVMIGTNAANVNTLSFVAPGANGNVLTSDGTTWTSAAPTAGGATLAGNTFTGRQIFSVNGAVSAPALTLTGSVVTGGTSTTNVPLIRFEPSGTTASTNWTTTGEIIGLNAVAGYTGAFIHCMVNNVDYFKVVAGGTAVVIGTGLSVASNITGQGNISSGSTVSSLIFGPGSAAGVSLFREPVNGWSVLAGNAASIFQDATTIASGTAANRYVFGIPTPTFSNSQTGVTNTVGSTLYIGGAPVNGTNTTVTTKYALNINSGNVNIGAGAVIYRGVTIANLPASPVAGMVVSITDGDAGLAWGATAVNTGAGATKYLVWHNGTNWTIAGK